MRYLALALLLAAPIAAHATDKPRIAAAKKAVADLMKDPSSVQFRKIRFGTTDKVVCGEANSKNSFGAYTGFMPFFVVDDDVTLVKGDGTPGDDMIVHMYSTFCPTKP
ncbi:hypothetical protein FHW12_000360 [Dokdonella fugitiva]|uniref:Uncharacterized protein n=1 Tax=Dokdonella fugitiva TaxID=328517 RepID=A0A839EWT4_9GAMM|nr:hypothetical protein [Dokdonella fugitiva]MBA8886169.1 hypothetical protein [Dokdonella fugitiva]